MKLRLQDRDEIKTMFEKGNSSRSTETKAGSSKKNAIKRFCVLNLGVGLLNYHCIRVRERVAGKDE